MQDFPFSLVISLISVGLIVLIVVIVAMWKIFEKAGQPGWKCIVPFYNYYTMLKIVGKPRWWLLLIFFPIVNWVFIIWTYNMLSKSFGKDEGFTVGLILLGFIFVPILGFGDAAYLGPYGDKDAFNAYRDQFTLDAERTN